MATTTARSNGLALQPVGDHEGVPHRRVPFDVAAYEHQVRTGECFICGLVRGSSTQPEHVIYRDQRAIAFLSRPVAQLGYSLVAPVEHQEDVVDSFDLDDYLAVQEVVYRVGRALTRRCPRNGST